MNLSSLMVAVLGLTMACGGSGDARSSTSDLGGATGVDYAWARPSPSGLRGDGYTFAARYLSWDTSGKNISAGEAQALKSAGVDVVVVWENTATATLGGYAQGVADAAEAASQASAAGMPSGRPIYFAIDFDAQPGDQPAIDSYFDGVASVIGRGRAGAYSGFYVMQRLFNDGKIAYGWQAYAWSYGNWDSRAQLRQVQNSITAGGDPSCCDADVAVADDFGQWGYVGAKTNVPSASDYVGIASTADGKGYWIAKGDGGVFSFCDAAFHGSAGGAPLNMSAVGMATTSDVAGYWIAGADGGLFAYGDAPFLGSMGGQPLNGPVVGIAGGKSGYWMVGDDGGVFAFGVPFYGSMGGKALNASVSGIAATPSGAGYWLVARDGGVFAFGDAQFYGSMGGTHLNAPVVGIAATPSGHGYWLVATDGGLFAFGDAQFYGSMGGAPLNAPVTGMAARPQGDGYWMVAKDGGVFAFGAAGFYGRP